MPVYAFEATDSKGQSVRKEIEAPSRDEAINKIRSMGFYPTRIKEKAGKQKAAAVAAPGAPAKKGSALSRITIGRVNLRQLTQFTGQLSTLQDAGLPIVRSIRILEGQLKPGLLKNTLLEVADDVEGGSTLSDAMGKHPKAFDRLYVNMVKAGEAGGVLDTILERLANFMEKSLRLKKKVMGALIYPIAVTIIAALILGGIMKFVIPAFQKMFRESGVPLPTITQILLGVSEWVSNWWFLLVFVPLIIYGILYAIGRTAKGRFIIDKIKLYMPLFGPIIRKSTISRFTRTLGTLIASGVPILEALSIVKEAVGNDVLSKAIDQVHGSIKEGESIARPLGQSGVFDDMLVNMVDVGEETGELDKMLIKIADNYDEDVDVAVEGLTSLLEPVLIVFMGGAVGFIVVALFMPLITLIQKL
jgi:type IV pilus assembly protein PilC